MRSLILTAAIAAALVSTSFTISYAAKSGGHSSRSERSGGDAHGLGISQAMPHGPDMA